MISKQVIFETVDLSSLYASTVRTQIEEKCARTLELPLLVRCLLYSSCFVSAGGRVCGVFPSRS